MTITDAMIEAGARALCRSDQLSPDALVTNFTAFRGQPLWKTYAVKAKSALVAAELAAWRPIEEAQEWQISYQKQDGEWTPWFWAVPATRKRVELTGKTRWGAEAKLRPLYARPLPTPGEPDER